MYVRRFMGFTALAVLIVALAAWAVEGNTATLTAVAFAAGLYGIDLRQSQNPEREVLGSLLIAFALLVSAGLESPETWASGFPLWLAFLIGLTFVIQVQVCALRSPPPHPKLAIVTVLAGSSLLVQLAPHWRQYDNPTYQNFVVSAVVICAIGAWLGRWQKIEYK